MAKPQHADVNRAAPRLYLVTPPVDDASGFISVLRDVIGATDIAALLLRLKPDAERAMIDRVKRIAALVQPKDIALVLDGHAGIVARAGADGAHLTGIETFTAEVASLKPARIAGCGGLQTRHDAMLAAERGADYVMFGEPDESGRRPSLAAIVERMEWWAEVFEIPCVGFAASVQEIAPLAATGAEFVAVGGELWTDPRGAPKAIAEAAARLTQPEAVP